MALCSGAVAVEMRTARIIFPQKRASWNLLNALKVPTVGFNFKHGVYVHYSKQYEVVAVAEICYKVSGEKLFRRVHLPWFSRPKQEAERMKVWTHLATSS
jgi:hypothetical protein